METADFVWGGLFAVGTAVEVYALRSRQSGDTLSERLRAWFRLDTRAGRLAFTSSWAAFSVWMWGHLLYGWPFPGF